MQIHEPVKLLPRLKEWIAQNNPGMKISIGEWNFGAEQHMSGGLAAAEALGRFGQAGIDSAFYWTVPPESSPAFWAFRAFRNYDGKGAHFLEESLTATSSDTMTSVFASKDPSGRMVSVVLNLDPSSPGKRSLSTTRVARPQAPSGPSRTRESPPASTRSLCPARGRDGRFAGAAITLPPYSMTVLEMAARRPVNALPSSWS